jgi:hypothetical protein
MQAPHQPELPLLLQLPLFVYVVILSEAKDPLYLIFCLCFRRGPSMTFRAKRRIHSMLFSVVYLNYSLNP